MIQMELMEKNRVYSLHLKNNNTHFNGFLRDIGDKWILMEDISLECMLDGVLLVNKEYINRIMRTEHDLFVENLIKSQRRQNKNLSNAYPLDDLDSLLHFIWKKGGLIMITKKEGGAGYVGEIARLLSSSIYLIEMDTDGNWINPPLLYRKKTIRTILIGNNYLNSLANYNRSKYTNESEIMIFTYHIKGWKETIKGILVQEEKEWLLIKLLTDDFILDGYSIIQKRYLSKKNRGSDEQFLENVLGANKKLTSECIDMPLETSHLIEYIMTNKISIGLNIEKENIQYIGKISKTTSKTFNLSALSNRGLRIKEDLVVKTNSIRAINISSNYIDSMDTYSSKIDTTLI